MEKTQTSQFTVGGAGISVEVNVIIPGEMTLALPHSFSVEPGSALKIKGVEGQTGSNGKLIVQGSDN